MHSLQGNPIDQAAQQHLIMRGQLDFAAPLVHVNDYKRTFLAGSADSEDSMQHP